MIPIVTPEEMAAIDAAAPEPVEVLIDRAGAAVAWAARRRLAGTYGRRVVVLAGKGNNGADGLVATRQDGLSDRIDDLDKAIRRSEQRLDTLEQQLVARFATLESLLARLQTQGSALSGFGSFTT